ncbi:MAG: DEAD/DEAH box helicase family protein, partial [Myxococcota bacterium]
MSPPPVLLTFDHGTVVIPRLPAEADALRGLLTEDPRTGRLRAPGRAYRALVLGLRAAGVPYRDEARRFAPLDLAVRGDLEPFPHQQEALSAWRDAGRLGVVEMPTGAGKTVLGALALADAGRPGLVVVPTIELLHQWRRTLEDLLGVEVGVIGGGEKERRDITVITYDSAALQVEFLGHRFGCLVFDEVHHLPSPAYRFIAEGSIAPFRIGLSATVTRPDGAEKAIFQSVGPLVHQVGIEALEGDYLAPYEVVTVPVALDPEEAHAYDEAREEYLSFVRSQGIRFSRPGGWADFIMRAHQSDAGRSAFRAYRRQRRIALASRAKVEALWTILKRHREDRVLVFTEDNETVYRLSRTFLLPALTHQTRPAERKALLEGFADGSLRVLVTAKVLNEGEVLFPCLVVGVGFLRVQRHRHRD